MLNISRKKKLWLRFIEDAEWSDKDLTVDSLHHFLERVCKYVEEAEENTFDFLFEHDDCHLRIWQGLHLFSESKYRGIDYESDANKRNN